MYGVQRASEMQEFEGRLGKRAEKRFDPAVPPEGNKTKQTSDGTLGTPPRSDIPGNYL
jgi:hypothetical protein